MIILMGVSGSGKTTIGKKLSKNTGMPYFDADDFHPTSNILKLQQGRALNDKDRIPWLDKLAVKVEEWKNTDGIILGCSALKEKYRQLLIEKNSNITWVFLSGSYFLIQSRLEKRTGHFMRPSLLKSQFDDLEIPDYGITVSIEPTPKEIVKSILEKLENKR